MIMATEVYPCIVSGDVLAEAVVIARVRCLRVCVGYGCAVVVGLSVTFRDGCRPCLDRMRVFLGVQVELGIGNASSPRTCVPGGEPCGEMKQSFLSL